MKVEEDKGLRWWLEAAVVVDDVTWAKLQGHPVKGKETRSQSMVRRNIHLDDALAEWVNMVEVSVETWKAEAEAADAWRLNSADMRRFRFAMDAFVAVVLYSKWRHSGRWTEDDEMAVWR